MYQFLEEGESCSSHREVCIFSFSLPLCDFELHCFLAPTAKAAIDYHTAKQFLFEIMVGPPKICDNKLFLTPSRCLLGFHPAVTPSEGVREDKVPHKSQSVV